MINLKHFTAALVLVTAFHSVTLPNANAILIGTGTLSFTGNALGGGIFLTMFGSMIAVFGRDSSYAIGFGSVMAAAGIIVLDSSSDKITFSDLGDEWSLKLDASPDDIAEYNENISSLNAATESFTEAYKNGEFESDESAVKVWDTMRAEALSPVALEISNRIGEYIGRQVERY